MNRKACNRVFGVFITLLFFLCADLILLLFGGAVVSASESGDFAGGDGTEASPYLIETPYHLNNLRKQPQAHFKQVADIDLSVYAENKGWRPIGYYVDWDDKKGFSGNLDGNGYIIENLTIDRGKEVNVGLFGYLNNKAVLQNLALEGVEVIGGRNTGALVGQNNRGTIVNCYAAGGVIGDHHVGGLVGRNDKGHIKESYSAVKVEGEWWTGGLVGYNWGKIKNCYATGEVRGHNYTGGLAGGNQAGEIVHSYAVGRVLGEKNSGGLTGWHMGTLQGCHYGKETTGLSDKGRGEPKTAEEMLRKESFENWDFVNVWSIIEKETYPYLQWQEDNIPVPE